MSLAIIQSRAQVGIDSPDVNVEVHLSNGLPRLSIVGLADTEVQESKDRVRAAILNSGFEFPARRITINLAPADLPKEGSRFDLPIALGILAASGQIPKEALEQYEFVGELALSGELRAVAGVLPATMAAREAGTVLVIPAGNSRESGLVSHARVLPVTDLLMLGAYLHGRQQLAMLAADVNQHQSLQGIADLADVKAQPRAKRALEIAAAGEHHMLMIGTPGTGKTMLATRLIGILPLMTEEEALESAVVQSISHHGFASSDWRRRPMRSPHHTASAVALVGGGSQPRPGEISLAHHGVLFLDELPEFDRRVLEVLREPLESGHIVISRAARQATFPAKFQLIAAMNPCPCGYFGHSSGRCRCTAQQVQRYRAKISGPLLDRIDLHVEVPSVDFSKMQSAIGEEGSEVVRQRVVRARQQQWQRAGKPNQRLENAEVAKYCALEPKLERFLEKSADKLGLSARAYQRILKVARTIADLDQSYPIRHNHLSEALSYRCLDRQVVIK